MKWIRLRLSEWFNVILVQTVLPLVLFWSFQSVHLAWAENVQANVAKADPGQTFTLGYLTGSQRLAGDREYDRPGAFACLLSGLFQLFKRNKLG